ncbi:unnamed protein product [Phytophthora lilii]|uniref:Unnamed protein product n=1 Tax=Phytophthora lilii TaxID=2077276 RepID=A0A9W6XJ07_9STRA|nr:unnamed protein product [Phytophthora lilii]
MEQAVATGNLSLVKWISEFMCKHSLHDELSDDIMSAAICGGHIDVAEHLVSVGQFEWYSVNYDLDEALRRGQFDVVDRIFKTCCLYPHTNDLFANIARSGLTNDMRYLYSQELVTPEMTEDAFRSACVGSTSSTMKYLLDTGSISSKMFDRFFEKRALFGKDSVLKFLYEQNRVSTPSLKRAFEYSRSLVAVKLLYQSGKILPDSVIVLFRNAANGGDVGGLPFPPNPEIVKFLLSGSCIPVEEVTKAFTDAVAKGQVNMVASLCDDHRLSSEMITHAFAKATNSGDVKMMQVLRSRIKTLTSSA